MVCWTVGEGAPKQVCWQPALMKQIDRAVKKRFNLGKNGKKMCGQKFRLLVFFVVREVM